MMEKLDLKKLKIQTRRTILEDGLLEIMLGVYFILSAFYLINKTLIINYFFLPVALVLIDVLRRRYVYPRTGFAKLNIPAVELIRVFLGIILGIALITGIVALVATGFGKPVQGNWKDIFTFALILFTTLFFCILAYRFKVHRWYLHGFLIGFAILLNQFVKIPLLVIVLGLFMITTGLWVFIRFLRNFPEQPDAVPDYAQATPDGEQS